MERAEAENVRADIFRADIFCEEKAKNTLTKEKNMVEYQKIRKKEEGVLSWNTKKWMRRL